MSNSKKNFRKNGLIIRNIFEKWVNSINSWVNYKNYGLIIRNIFEIYTINPFFAKFSYYLIFDLCIIIRNIFEKWVNYKKYFRKMG